MAKQISISQGERQTSEVVFVFAILLGALALLCAVGGLFILDLLKRAEPYLTGHSDVVLTTAPINAPKLATQIDGNQSNIVEIGLDGQVLRTIHSSEIKDHVASFTLFAVPQTDFNGLAYIQATPDANSGTLIIYPLEVMTGKLSPAVINVPSASATVSPNQTRVAVINQSPIKAITVFELTTGATLASWTLATNERVSNDPVTWISDTCFEHVVSASTGAETRTFCLPL